jgi:hypothetical protein
VKVEVWDVVDKARRRKTTANQSSGGLKLNNNDTVEYEETDDEMGIRRRWDVGAFLLLFPSFSSFFL